MVEFPVFVSSRDSGEMKRYRDLQQMQHALERIDVENGEYVVWDRMGRLVSLLVRQGPGWLELRTEAQAVSEFQEALRRFARSAGVELSPDSVSMDSAEGSYENVAERISKKRDRLGWFARLKQRF